MDHQTGGSFLYLKPKEVDPMAKNRKCISCGEKYSYCPTCSRAAALEPSWKSEFCSETCMTLWTILTKYGMEFLSKDEAKEIISNLDLKPIGVYADCVQRDYAKVMAEEKKLRKAHKKIEPVVEIEPVIEQLIEITESHEVVKKEENE